jgi:hypothetical protein
MTNRKNIDEVLKALEHRSQELYLVANTYTGVKNKAVFIDLQYGEFTAQPNWIIKGRSHPARTKLKRNQTNLERYGSISPFGAKATHEKSRLTNLERYGVEKPLQSEQSKEKFKTTSLERFGTEHPFQNQSIKDKIIKTNQTRYGVDNFFQTFTKYTHEGKSLSAICREKGVPKSSASIICRDSGLEAAMLYVNNYTASMTDIETILQSKMPNLIFMNCRPEGIKYKVDFKEPMSGAYIEADGLYWHSEVISKDKTSHLKKRKAFEIENARLLQFRADEIKYKFQIVESIVNNLLGKSHKFDARKCDIREVDGKTAKAFLEINHLMGSIKAKHTGLYLDNELMSLLSWSMKKDVLKIDRFCSKAGTVVRGGFERLLKTLPKAKEIHYWVDLRYGTGKHLESKGFVVAKETLGWKWTDYDHTFNRLRCRANMDERGLSEREHADELGWVKIYDAGQRLFIKYS